MAKLTQGCIQIYTGNGKGKTTAAMGQAVRAVGGGYRVYIVQFLKNWDTGELHSLKKFEPELQIFRFEKPRKFFWELNEEEKAEVKKEIQTAFEFCKKVFQNKECDILIMDEVMGAIGNNLLDIQEVVDFMHSKPEDMELVMTGRNVPEAIMEAADLVTEMREIKHYYAKGVPARKGIEF